MKTKFTFLIVMLFLIAATLSAQTRVITGKVTTDKGTPLVSATIIAKGTAVGTYTKTDGSFKIQVPNNTKVLIFKLLGMKQKEVEIGSSDVINVSMDEDKILMDEVVVTAIGLEREKKSLGYSVEDVKGSTISESKAVSVVNALSGKVAGVNVVNSAGTPGASSFITIRGISSITGENQPLFVVDGIPIDNSQDYSGNPADGSNNLLWGVANSNRAIDINPDDIETISVLKGPAATALYGIRATSGAIIISTKRGGPATDERVNVSYTTSLAYDEVNNLPELQSKFSQGTGGQIRGPESFSSLSWGANFDTLYWNGDASYKYDKNGKLVGASDPTKKTKATPYDNLGNFFQIGRTFSNSLSIAGGNELGSFFFSLSNSEQSGIVPNSSFGRTTLRINGDTKISNSMKISGGASYTNSGGSRTQQGSNTSGVMLGLLRSPASFDNSNGYGKDGYKHQDAYMYVDRGTQRTFRGESDGRGKYDNPFWTVNENPFTDNVDRFMGNIQLNYYFTDWFDAMYRLGADVYSDNRVQHFAIWSNTKPAGQTFNQNINNQDINSDLMLNFNYSLTQDISGKLTLGQNLFQSSYQNLYAQGDGLASTGFFNLNNTASQIVNQRNDKLRRMAYYGDLTLNYKSWLYLNGTLRDEWSTTLPENNNSFMYGSGNLSFIFTEAFKGIFEKSPLSLGKLRLNYAMVGKDAPLYSIINQYYAGYYADGWTSGDPFPFMGTVGYSMGDILGNSGLRPEKTTSMEVGLALNFFENLFGFDFTYYNQLGKDQIFAVPIASSSGYTRQMMNAGEISNKGYEILFNASPLKPLTKDFVWNLAVNFSKNDNLVEKLAPGVDVIFLGGFSGTSVRAVAGKPFGTIFGPGWYRDGNGNLIIDSRDSVNGAKNANKGKPILDPTEKDWGSFQPDWRLGITNSFSYEGITLSFLIDIKKGGKLWNGTRGALIYFGTAKETDVRGTTKVFDGVKGYVDANNNVVTSGEKNDISTTLDQSWFANGPANGFTGNNTEDFVEDAGYVRLREVSLSYALPKSIVKMAYLSDIIITFTGRNLWLSTNYKGVDPETNLMGSSSSQGMDYFNMPGTKTYNISLSVRF